MNLLNILVCITVIFWIAIGIRIHSDWIQTVFLNESKKIKQQEELISEFGYGSLNTRNKLAAKKGLVFAYWDTAFQQQEHAEYSENLRSPIIFQLVNLNLIAGTSIMLLIFLSKGLFASMGLI
jgi:hypothetical protein